MLIKAVRFFAVLASFLSFLFFHHYALAGNIYVNSDGVASDVNPGNGTCETSAGNGVCTLRAAIEEANSLSPGSIILFTDKFMIAACDLPALTAGQIVINGYDQWDTVTNSPGIDLFRPLGCSSSNLYHLTINSNDNHVYGLYFRSDIIGASGIKIAGGSGNIIGADATYHRNVFVLPGYGVEDVSSASNNTISSNYFGTINGVTSVSISGTNGIRNISSGNTITSNVIAGQDRTTNSAGIHLSGNSNTVDSNIIGLNKPVINALPNSIGIYVEFANDSNISNNTVGGNSSYGIWLGTNAGNNDINNNIIGAPPNINTLGNLNHGVYSTSSSSNIIRKNHIDANSGSGIYAQSAGALIIKGNTIVDNLQHGVHFSQIATGTIGGGSYLNVNFRNEIYRNSLHGIYLEGSSSVTISGNFIGQKYSPDTSSIVGNLQSGIMLDSGANGNTIGGNSADEANWIAWNQQDGIVLSGATTTNNNVKNNIIGAPYLFYWPTPNKYTGISIILGAHDNTIGGAGVGNVILASGANGIYIFDSDNNLLQENMIGTDGTHNWGNGYNGISIWEGSGTLISKNKIAYNSPTSTTGGGIKIQGSSAINNKISENSIHDNGGFGIDLTSGANAHITSPVISRVGKTVSGTTCPGCTVEIFTDALDQGRYFEGSTVADGTGNYSWTGTFQGNFVTATATDTALNTSMFSSAIRSSFPWTMFIPAITKAQ